MEMKKRRQKTLTGLFLKFAALFCLDTFGIGMVCLLLLVLSPMTGFTLPANYAELQLTDHTEEIKAAGTEVEALIPDGCRYGIYDAAGQFKTGTFSADAQKRAWQGYKNGSKYASMGKFYCYIKQSSGDICIVTYDLHMRYVVDKLNGIVPSPEILAPVLGVVLFFLHAILLSGHFAKKLYIRQIILECLLILCYVILSLYQLVELLLVICAELINILRLVKTILK